MWGIFRLQMQLQSFDGFTDEEEMKLMLAYDGFMLLVFYIGLTTLAGGAILWLASPKTSERSSKGVYLVISGIAMLMIYFGIEVLMDILNYIILSLDS